VTAVPARVVAALVVALALVSGVLLGIVGDRQFLLPGGHRHGMMPAPSPTRFLLGPPDGGRSSGRPFEPNAEWVTKRLAEDLSLTPAQRTRIDSIVTRRMAERRDLMAPIRDRMRQLLDSTRADVEAVLTPEQRATLDKLRSRGDGSRDSRDRPPPSPPGN
jgi:Spy/CpxP family protein refolding chaperone